MNKRFFKFKSQLSIKYILDYLDISEETFYKYNNKNTKALDIEINQFSSLTNSCNDSLIFINKNISPKAKNIKGVCLMKTSLEKFRTRENIIIPSENPKLDFCVIKLIQK